MKNTQSARILIADDQPDVLEALRLMLKGEGFQIESANSPSAVLAALEMRDFDVVIMDLNYTRDTTSGQEGLDLLVRAPSEPALRARWHGPYLEGEVPLDPWGNPYQYSPTGRDLNAITLYSYGPTGKPGGDAVGYLPAG